MKWYHYIGEYDIHFPHIKLYFLRYNGICAINKFRNLPSPSLGLIISIEQSLLFHISGNAVLDYLYIFIH